MPLNGTPTSATATLIEAITNPPTAVCDVTEIQVVEMILAVLNADLPARNKLLAAANNGYIIAGITMSKRGHVTRDYLRKQIPALRQEFQPETLEFTVSVVSNFWSRHLCKVTHAQAGPILNSFAQLARVESVVFREIMRQAQYGGYTSALIILTSLRKYSDFPWDSLITGAG